jgi:tRNA pseudouridine55 synthase
MEAKRWRGRDISGVLLFDKPQGLSSNDALQRVKRLYAARKAGHTGSLDLLATGLLPICFGEATKLSGFLLDADKRYHAVFKLGLVTTTGDAEGEVIEARPVPALSAEQVVEVLRTFTGRIAQVPPMHSAIKHQGRRLYELAHRGISVPRTARPVTIHQLRLERLDGDCLEVAVSCSKGTYIRTLAEDIGMRLGCGAHVIALRRVGVGPFDISDAVGLGALEARAGEGFEALDAAVLGLDTVLSDEPLVSLSEDAAYYLCRGQPVCVPHAPTAGLVRLYDHHRQFLGVGRVLDDGRIAPRRLVRAGLL